MNEQTDKQSSDERINLWIGALFDDAALMFEEVAGLEDERVNMAEVTIGLVRAAVRLTLCHAPPGEAPGAMQMLAAFMRKEMLEQVNPESVKH